MTDPIEDGVKLAFPVPAGGVRQEGMTLRDYFAAKAMPALLQLDKGSPKVAGDAPQVIAVAAYTMADAMLTERARKP